MGTFRTCSNCMYFDTSLSELGSINVPANATATGLCKHDPPTIDPNSQKSSWPGVSSGDWCGQHTFVQQGPSSTFQTQADITRQGGGRI